MKNLMDKINASEEQRGIHSNMINHINIVVRELIHPQIRASVVKFIKRVGGHICPPPAKNRVNPISYRGKGGSAHGSDIP